jgi:hypothetical protein
MKNQTPACRTPSWICATPDLVTELNRRYEKREEGLLKSDRVFAVFEARVGEDVARLRVDAPVRSTEVGVVQVTERWSRA